MWDKRGDMIIHSGHPFNAEPPRSALGGTDVTPRPSFYVRNHGPVPETGPTGWTVRVDGLVERPATLSVGDLRDRFDEHVETVTLQCAGNRRTGLLEVADIPGEAPWGPGATATARWTGVRLADVLRAAGAGPAATDVAFLGADVSTTPHPPEAFSGSIPLGKALAPEVLLAWAMNDDPLPRVHGAPLRVVVPGYIGARSVKWLAHITVRDRPSDSFFQARSYRLLTPGTDPSAMAPGEGVELGPVAVNSDILAPDDGARVPVGRATVSGYAFAGGDRTVVRVDVSVDGGATWCQAELGAQPSRWTWRRWHVDVPVAAGVNEVLARAWDSSAALQPERAGQVWNPKGYVNNSWARIRLQGV